MGSDAVSMSLTLRSRKKPVNQKMVEIALIGAKAVKI